MAWADSHCHVAYEGVGLEAVARARDAGVERVISIGTDVERSADALAAVREGRSMGLAMWATVGVHPHDAMGGLGSLEDLVGQPEVVGVGECGFDYFYEHSDRVAQREVFAAQIDLARRSDLTLVIHTRDAWDDTFAVLDEVGTPERTIVHCFSGGPGEARRSLDRGAYLSFSGIVTFKNAADLRAAAAVCPLDRLLVETDAPFLAPVPHRGKPNEPAWVALVGAALATVRGERVEQIEDATWANTEAAFALDRHPIG